MRPVRISALLIYLWLPLSLLAMLHRHQHEHGTVRRSPAGSQRFNEFYGRLIPLAVGAALVAWVPTLLVRGPLHRAWRFLFVLLHVAVGSFSYFAAAASLAYHLN